MPEVSVIIPAYKPQDFNALIASMYDNAGVDAEWIVVDDGSGSAYDSVYASLPASVRRIRLRANGGQAAARNVGLAHATGMCVKFLDSDDRLDPGHLEALLSARGRERAIPFAPTLHVFSGGATLVNDSWNGLSEDPESQLARLLHSPFLHHCGALFPRDLLLMVGGYDESLVTDEDGDLLIRILMAGSFFTAVPEVNYHYVHAHGHDRVSSDKGSAKLAARLRVCDKIEAAFTRDQVCIPSSVRRGLALRMDKIALSYWHEDRVAARDILDRAHQLCPCYLSNGWRPAQLVRLFGGPSAMIVAAQFWRRLRGRPVGGMQG